MLAFILLQNEWEIATRLLHVRSVDANNHFAAQCLARNETDSDKTNDEVVITHMEVAVQFQVVIPRNDTTHNHIVKCRTVITNCKNRRKYSVEFVIVQQMFTPILGKRNSEQMGLVHVNYDNISAVTKDKMNFDHIFADEESMIPRCVHLTRDESIMPAAVTSSRVSISMKKM